MWQRGQSGLVVGANHRSCIKAAARLAYREVVLWFA
jgi:hypothetical protein